LVSLPLTCTTVRTGAGAATSTGGAAGAVLAGADSLGAIAGGLLVGIDPPLQRRVFIDVNVTARNRATGHGR